MNKENTMFFSEKNYVFNKNFISSKNRNYEENLKNLLKKINSGDLIIIKKVIPNFIINTLRNLCKDKLYVPNEKFFKLKKGIPNNVRVHIPRKTSLVPAKFNAFNYYPWNSESNEMFEQLNNLFLLRTKLADIDISEIISTHKSNYTARIALQYYPNNFGFFKEHRDPYDFYQIAIPTISLFNYGEDFDNGGFYLKNKSNQEIFLDKHLEAGDAILFHSCISHGVKTPQKLNNEFVNNNSDCSEYINGRLMLLCAVNKMIN